MLSIIPERSNVLRDFRTMPQVGIDAEETHPQIAVLASGSFDGPGFLTLEERPVKHGACLEEPGACHLPRPVCEGPVFGSRERSWPLRVFSMIDTVMTYLSFPLDQALNPK